LAAATAKPSFRRWLESRSSQFAQQQVSAVGAIHALDSSQCRNDGDCMASFRRENSVNTMNPDHRKFISGQFAQYAANPRYNDLSEGVRQLAHLVLLDMLGCAMASAGTEEIAQIRRAMYQAIGSSGGLLSWGTNETAPLPLAALANGTAVHAREIDDFGGCAHSGSVVIPAAPGVAARAGASGRELLTAIVIG
jgi:hypothetical protein